MLKKHTIAITTNSSGAATGYTPPVSGFVRAIVYVPHGTTPLDTNGDIVVTGNTSSIAILTKANIGTSSTSWQPRAATHAVGDGSALLYASGGTAQCDLVPVADEAIKLVVAQGGDALSGTFYVYVDGV
jgi:hypothetical protein